MTTIQSPSHALGLMAISCYGELFKLLPECVNSTDGPSKIYGIILGLDGLLVSYQDKMNFTIYDNSGAATRVPYWKKMIDLNNRKKDLTFGNSAYGEQWADWFHEYLLLLSSCFNHIGLAPLKISDNIDWDDEPYIPPEHRTDSESPDQEVSG